MTIEPVDTGIFLFSDKRVIYHGIRFNFVEYYPSVGMIHIKKIDWQNKIVAGVFSCEFFDKDSNLIKIDSGRFDVTAND